jgi:hypothetical protein
VQLTQARIDAANATSDLKHDTSDLAADQAAAAQLKAYLAIFQADDTSLPALT